VEIIIAKNAGFCAGVKNAVDTAFSNAGENTFVLGELIHNQKVIEDLEKLNIKTIKSIDEADSGTVIIRSHGVGSAVYESIKKKNLKIIDCTCKFVNNIHEKVKEFFQKGYQIVIIGEKNHPEVVGINGWCNDSAVIFSKLEDVFDISCCQKICVVAQTTVNENLFNQIIQKITAYPLKIVEVFNTICYTTICRHKEAEELSKISDCVVVIGGKNSSNTKNLFETAKLNCKNVFWISDTDEFDYKKIGKYKKVAILAGASTPIEEILEVKHNMEEVTLVDGQKPNVEGKEEKMSMEQVLKQINSGQKKYAKGQEIKTTIVLANDEGLMLQIGSKKGEVLLSKSEINLDGSYDKTAFCSGDEIEVVVTEIAPLAVSRKKLLENRIEEEKSIGIEEGSVFKITISGFNKGGLVGKVGAANVFVPSSQIRLGFVKAEELERYVNKELKVKAIKIEGKKVVASQRAVIEEERAAKDAEKHEIAENFFSKLELNQIVNGKVVRFADFGAFVNVDGFDCLAHVSDLSYKPGIKAEEILEKGNSYDFKVLKIDKEKQQVSLGYKQLQKRPWEIAAEKYPINSVLKGKVVRLTNFGAFIEIEPGFDGLVHVSQISNEWIENPAQALSVGQEVDVLVLDVNPEAEKLTLSIKALLPPVEKAPEQKAEEKVKPKDSEKMRDNSRDNNKDRKERAPRRNRENSSDEPREWISGDNGGASIGELLKDFKFE